jgi:hypothetical protein
MFLHRGFTVWGLVAFVIFALMLRVIPAYLGARALRSAKTVTGNPVYIPSYQAPSYRYQPYQYQPNQFTPASRSVPQFQYRPTR